MNLKEAEKIINIENEKKISKNLYMRTYRKQKNNSKNKNNLENTNTNTNIEKISNYKNIEKEIIPKWEKNGNKNLKKETALDYCSKIIRIHKKITNNELNKDILLNILNNNYDEDDIKYILDNLYYLNENNIIKTLKKFYDNNTTIKTYLIPYAILTSYIPHYRENNIYINIAKEIIKIGNEYENDRDNNDINMDDKNKIIENYDNNKLNDIKNIEDKLIYSLYTLIPPRRLEYSNMKIINITELDNINDEYNYIILNKIPEYFIFNNYKTKNIFGQQKILIPKILQEIIEEYLLYKNKKDGDKLLDMTSNVLGKKIGNIFKKIYNENITLRWLRISYATQMRKKQLTNNELKIISEKMGHSLLTNSRYNKIIK